MRRALVAYRASRPVIAELIIEAAVTGPKARCKQPTRSWRNHAANSSDPSLQPLQEHAMVYLVVGLDRSTYARWHAHVAASDVSAAEDVAQVRAAAQGILLVVAATIGPYSSIAGEPDGPATSRIADDFAPALTRDAA